MAKSVNPVDMALGLPRQQLQWAQSIHKVLNGQISPGTPLTQDATGNFNTFSQDNMSGQLIRIGASGGLGNTYNWTTSNTPIQVNHSLVDSNNKPRQPIGFHIVNKDKSMDAYITQTPDSTYLYIAPTDATANCTIYVF